MKIQDIDLFEKEDINSDILNLELSKKSLKEYYQKTGTIIQIILQDNNTIHVYEEGGSYPFDMDSDMHYDPTGYFKDKIYGRVKGNTIKIYGSCKNNFDCINYFENDIPFDTLFN